jgi:GNAT superfamily N-acetyltransferase
MPSDNLITRYATSNDAQYIAEILQDIGWFEVFNVKPLEEVTSTVEHYIQACDNSGSSFLVAEHRGSVVGFAVVDWRPIIGFGYEGYLSQLYVHSNTRGNGIGHQLVEAVKSEAQKRNCQKLMTYISRTRSTYDRQFYPKSGWTERENAAMYIMKLPAT